MHTNKIRTLFHRPAAAAAAVAICICVLGTTALASSGHLEGFFQNIFGWNGAIVGTSYAQATDELALLVVDAEDQLLVEVTMVYPGKLPYRELETLSVGAYQILDDRGQVAAEGTGGEMGAVAGGKALVAIPLETLQKGTYRLVVRELIGGKKADQPLVLQGNWECTFTK